LAFATFLVWRLQTGACGVGACGFWRYRMPPKLGYVRLGLHSGYELWHLRLFSFYGYGLALAALALVLFGAYDSYPALISAKKTSSS